MMEWINVGGEPQMRYLLLQHYFRCAFIHLHMLVEEIVNGKGISHRANERYDLSSNSMQWYLIDEDVQATISKLACVYT